MELPILLVLGDCNVHADEAAITQEMDWVTSMTTLGFLIYIRSHASNRTHTGYDLWDRNNVDLDTSDAVPWSDHFAPKV